MRKALIVGIDHYDQIQSLSGAVKDAYSVKSVLERHADGTLNFAQPKLLAATGPGAPVTRTELREAVDELFRDDAEISLFYFSGHGYIDAAGGVLCASDCVDGHDGLSLSDVMAFANNSPAKNKVIMLDSSGAVAEGSGQNIFVVKKGELRTPPPYAGLLKGVTRDAVMELALQAGYKVEETILNRYDIYTADEAFFTGTATEIVAIRQLDGRTIGSGKAGPVTRDLRARFQALARS